jgi:glutathione S-transferase
MATLYRCPTPTDWLCPCGRVARALHREGVAHEQVEVTYRRGPRDEVKALSGQDRVPLLILDGEVICDSKRIIEHLEYRRRAVPQSPPATAG